MSIGQLGPQHVVDSHVVHFAASGSEWLIDGRLLKPHTIRLMYQTPDFMTLKFAGEKA